MFHGIRYWWDHKKNCSWTFTFLAPTDLETPFNSISDRSNWLLWLAARAETNRFFAIKQKKCFGFENSGKWNETSKHRRENEVEKRCFASACVRVSGCVWVGVSERESWCTCEWVFLREMRREWVRAELRVCDIELMQECAELCVCEWVCMKGRECVQWGSQSVGVKSNLLRKLLSQKKHLDWILGKSRRKTSCEVDQSHKIKNQIEA